MSAPKADQPLHDKPTPDDLAGTPVCKEEDNPTIRVRGSGGVPAGGRGRKRVRGATPPTADDLAGIPVSVDGEDDRTVRPRKPRRKR